MTAHRLHRAYPALGPHAPSLPPSALALLLEASECALRVGADPWEFSIEGHALRAAGLTPTQLRWLLHEGYLAQAVEVTKAKASHRTFRQVANLSLPERACFILTEAGAGCARNLPEEEGRRERGPAEKPVWDRQRRQLRLSGVVVKRFLQPAANQEAVLEAFEEEGWPPRIDDPLPPQPDQDAKRRLHSTISNLNRGQAGRRILFGGGGDGESVCWRRGAAREEGG